MSDHLQLLGPVLCTASNRSRATRSSIPWRISSPSTRRGHCEYFAGALVMMLRSQGIPARMAIGFKGGEWNPLGMYYQVQQLHAHAWVEVLSGGEPTFPMGEFADDEAAAAAWLVLDPTDGAQESSDGSGGSGDVGRLHQYLDYAQVLWTNYVVGLNSKRQRQGIYEPLADGVVAAVENRRSAARCGKIGCHASGRLARGHILGLVSPALVQLARRTGGGRLFADSSSPLPDCGRWLRRRAAAAGTGRRGPLGDEPPVLEMYRRLEAALARQGLSRHPAQTAYEFAVAAGGDLAEHIEHRRVAHLPRRIVDVVSSRALRRSHPGQPGSRRGRTCARRIGASALVAASLNGARSRSAASARDVHAPDARRLANAGRIRKLERPCDSLPGRLVRNKLQS